MAVTDRIESKKAEYILIFLHIAFAILLSLAVIIAITSKHLRFSDFRSFTLPFIMMVNAYSLLNRQKGQFIEWRADEILYKTKGEEGTVEIKDIKNITIHLDTIVIDAINNYTYTINIQNFTKYETRLRIKENFTKLQIKSSL